MTNSPAAADPRRAREAALRPMGPRGEGWIGLPDGPRGGDSGDRPADRAGLGRAGTDRHHDRGPRPPRNRRRRLRLGRIAPRRHFSIWVDPRAGGRLVTSGPYRFTRHPVCTAQIALCLGWALVAASPVALLLVPAVPWYLDRYKLAREEQTLLAKYPEYAAYMRAVPHRMLPVPPRRLVPSGPAGA